jgi:hypothetical protein
LGEWARLSVGELELNCGIKYTIPFVWTMIFPAAGRGGKYKTDVKTVKKFLTLKGIKLKDVEELLPLISGATLDQWKENRDIVLAETESNNPPFTEINGNLPDPSPPRTKEIFEFDDNEALDILGEVEDLEMYGKTELIALYKLLLAINQSDNADDVILDLSDFIHYYRGPNRDARLFEDAKTDFVNNVITHGYIFMHGIEKEDRKMAFLRKIRQFTSEDTFMTEMVVPLLKKMQFYNVSQIKHHGPGEHGIDIGPFSEINRLDRINYWGAQVKIVDIHKNARKSEGNIELITGQIKDALHTEFQVDNTKIRIEKVMLITSKTISNDAKEYIRNEFGGIIPELLDGEDIADLSTKWDLSLI